jgi:hypothetical protein
VRGGGARAERRRLRLDKGCSSRDDDSATTAPGKYYGHRSDPNCEHEYPGTDETGDDHFELSAV